MTSTVLVCINHWGGIATREVDDATEHRIRKVYVVQLRRITFMHEMVHTAQAVRSINTS